MELSEIVDGIELTSSNIEAYCFLLWLVRDYGDGLCDYDEGVCLSAFDVVMDCLSSEVRELNSLLNVLCKKHLEDGAQA